MEKCTTCNGEGLVGQGPRPEMKVGRLDTCPTCLGKGEVPAGLQDSPEMEIPEKKQKNPGLAEGDEETPEEKKGFFEKIFG